jgi:hypothetical protein
MNINTTIYGYIVDDSTTVCTACVTDAEKANPSNYPILAYNESHDGLYCDRCLGVIIEPEERVPDSADILRREEELEDWLDPLDEDDNPRYNPYD